MVRTTVRGLQIDRLKEVEMIAVNFPGQAQLWSRKAMALISEGFQQRKKLKQRWSTAGRAWFACWRRNGGARLPRGGRFAKLKILGAIASGSA